MRIDELKKIAGDCDYKIVDLEINIVFERDNKPFNKRIRIRKSLEQGLHNSLTDEILDDKDNKMLEAVKKFCEVKE